MNRSFVRQAALAVTYAVLAIGVTVLPATPVLGASFTFSDSSCASFNLVPPPPTGGSYTLQCSQLSCTIAPAPSANVMPNNLITLTATCASADANATYAWTLVSGGDPTCPAVVVGATPNVITETDPSATTTSCTYKVVVADGGLGGATLSQAVTWTNAPPPQPSGCVVSISTNPSPLTSAAGSVMPLVTGCLPSTVTYNWARNGVAGWSTLANPTDTLPANMGTAAVTVNYALTACNGPTCTTFAPAQTATQPGTGGGGGGGANCSAQGFTTTRNLTLNWGPVGTGNVQVFSTTAGGFGYNEALVIQFTTPSTSSASVGYFTVYEYASQPTIRTVALSTTACDFTGLAQQLGKDPSIYFTVGGGNQTYINLTPNTTYYLNIENHWGSTNTCAPGAECNVGVELGRPSGL